MNSGDWLSALSHDDRIRPQPGARAEVVAESESALGVTLPVALRELYLESDGVWDEPGQWFVIWPLVRVVEQNRGDWGAGSAARDAWIAFGDDGTGNPFCVQRSGGDDVYFWSSIDQEATLLASDAAVFWRAWITDSLPPH